MITEREMSKKIFGGTVSTLCELPDDLAKYIINHQGLYSDFWIDWAYNNLDDRS